MMRRMFLTWVMICLAFPVTAFAQDSYEDPSLIEKRHQQRAIFFAPHDENFDGALDAFELQAMIVHDFRLLDLNGDHLINEAEREKGKDRFEQFTAFAYGPRIAKSVNDYELRLKNIDDNDDELISFVEYQGYLADRYRRMDQDKNGAISISEFRAFDEKVPGR